MKPPNKDEWRACRLLGVLQLVNNRDSGKFTTDDLLQIARAVIEKLPRVDRLKLATAIIEKEKQP